MEKGTAEGKVYDPENILSLEYWGKAKEDLFDYFKRQEGLLKLIAFCVTLSGLFLNVESENLHLKRVIALFLLITSFLISVLTLKSLFLLLRKRGSELYFSLILVPIFLGGIFLWNFWNFLIKDFSSELSFYLRWLIQPFCIILANFLFVIFFKFVSKYKKIDGKQLETFFLINLSTYLLLNFEFKDTSSSLLEVLKSIFSLSFSSLFLVYCFFITFLSEISDLRLSKKDIHLDTIAYVLVVATPIIIDLIIRNFYLGT